MLFPRVFELLAAQHVEGAAEAAAGRPRLDHVVDEAAARGDERVGEFLAVILRARLDRSGRVSVAALLRSWIMPMGPFQMRATGANLQPAAVLLVRGESGQLIPIGIHVLTFRDGRVQVIDAFMDPQIAARFA